MCVTLEYVCKELLGAASEGRVEPTVDKWIVAVNDRQLIDDRDNCDQCSLSYQTDDIANQWHCNTNQTLLMLAICMIN